MTTRPTRPTTTGNDNDDQGENEDDQADATDDHGNDNDDQGETRRPWRRGSVGLEQRLQLSRGFDQRGRNAPRWIIARLV